MVFCRLVSILSFRVLLVVARDQQKWDSSVVVDYNGVPKQEAVIRKNTAGTTHKDSSSFQDFLLQVAAFDRPEDHKLLGLIDYQTVVKNAILKRFDETDSNKDGLATLEEMKVSFEATLPEEETMIKSMMANIGSHDSVLRGVSGDQSKNETTVSRNEMVAYLNHLEDPMKFKEVLDEFGGGSFVKITSDPKMDCGPANACKRKGPFCFNTLGALSWLLDELCTKECRCEPDAESHFFARLALSGCLAAHAIDFGNFDSTKPLETPQCGTGWTSYLETGYADISIKSKDFIEKTMTELTARLFLFSFEAPQKYAEKMMDQTTAEVEVMLWKHPNHKLSQDGTTGPVCMITWLATESFADWKANMMVDKVDFKYGPGKVSKGTNLMYESARDKIKARVEAECCTSSFKAQKFVISGHSAGGGFSVLNAADMVRNWECGGDDLKAHDIVVAAFAGAPAYSGKLVDDVFSCSNVSECLPHRSLTFSTENDYVGQGLNINVVFQNIARKVPFGLGKPTSKLFKALPPLSTKRIDARSSPTTTLECKGPPEGGLPGLGRMTEVGTGPLWGSHRKDWWCHGLYEYAWALDDFLEKGGWGHSCGSTCGNPNTQIMKGQIEVTLTPQNPSYTPTPCNGCNCTYDDCWTMTSKGFCVA